MWKATEKEHKTAPYSSFDTIQKSPEGPESPTLFEQNFPHTLRAESLTVAAKLNV